MVRIDDDARVYIAFGRPGTPATFTVDATGAVVTLEVTLPGGTAAPGSPYATVWTVGPTQVGDVWTGIATTTKYFTGTNVAATGQDVALGAGRSMGQFIATMSNGERLPGPEFPIDVT